MAIYKVTDLKTDEVTTTSDLRDLFEKNKLEDDTYESFMDEVLASKRLQTQLGVAINEVNPVDAVILTREELDDATKRNKDAKSSLQKMIMNALDSIDDTSDVETGVAEILKASKSAPANILKWFKTDDKSGLTLSKAVQAELERVAKDRRERTSSRNNA